MTASDATQLLEIVNPDFPRGPFRVAIFDFDGTLSLIRRNWQNTMIPMMVDELVKLNTGESPEELHNIVEQFVMRLNGRQTIYQMIQLTEEIKKRGGKPREPLEYKHQYHDLLWQQVSLRIDAIQSGKMPPEDATVPGSAELLQTLQESGVELYLASGTDLKYVELEVKLLTLHEYFAPRIHGALDDYKTFSKAKVIANIIRDTNLNGEQIVGFGDGFVEIEEVKRVGGLAIGVASNEEERSGIDAWKRERLIRAGADIILGDYRQRTELLRLIGIGPSMS